jgi:hypothetical protein
VPLDLCLARPDQHRVRGQLGAVIADDHAWPTTFGNQADQLAHDPLAGDRGVHHRTQAFARDVVDDVEHAESPASGKLVMHEVQAPALVGERQHRPRRPRADGAPSPLPAPDRQPLLPVDPLRLLAVDRDAVPPQQDVQSAVAETASLAGQLAQTCPQILVALATRAVAHARPVGPDHGAGAPLAHPEPSLQPRDRLPLGGHAHHFFASRSFNPALSSMASASSRLSLPFSSSSARNRFASDTSKPPYLAFQAY